MSCITNCRTTQDLGFKQIRKYYKNFKCWWRRNPVPGLPSRNQMLTIAVKKPTKLDVTFLKPCPILLYFFTLCQLFWLGLQFRLSCCVKGSYAKTSIVSVCFVEDYISSLQHLRTIDSAHSQIDFPKCHKLVNCLMLCQRINAKPVIGTTKRQRTHINKASNINRIITMTSWRNQVTPY